MKVMGAFEYDMALMQKGEYRDYFSNKVTFREAVPITDEGLKQHIKQLFRMKFLRDFVLRPAVDEMGIAAINSLIMYSSVEICGKVNNLIPRKLIAYSS